MLEAEPDPVRVTANGDTIELEGDALLTDLLEVLGVSSKWVVAEVNGQAVERGDMAVLALSDGDRVELVRAVAGG